MGSIKQPAPTDANQNGCPTPDVRRSHLAPCLSFLSCFEATDREDFQLSLAKWIYNFLKEPLDSFLIQFTLIVACWLGVVLFIKFRRT